MILGETLEKSEPPTPRKVVKQRRIRTLKILGSWLLALAVALTLQRFVFQSYQVFGQSMEPTLSEGDYLIISKVGPTLANLRARYYVPERGEIVVVNNPIENNRLIKRVIGLPGERITVNDGKVRVYNREHRDGFDPYQELNITQAETAGQLSLVVPERHVFLIGDNRRAGGSLDSRNELGPIPVEDIIGKLRLRLWPFSKVDSF